MNNKKKSRNRSTQKKAQEAQPGRAELWRCLGCKFKSYLEHFKRSIWKKGNDGIGRHE